MSTQTIAQRRAAHALARIEKHEQRNRGHPEPDYGNYIGYVEALPATILTNGLGQACATLLSKDAGRLDRPHGLLYADLQDWLCGNDVAAPFRDSQYQGEGRLMEALCNSSQKRYLHAQTEAMAYLVWLKKFARAYLQHGERGGDE
ncbi:MAG: type III-B CRISPR module-associated protein Cmr5 [Verrucomicrobia bacterium]|nr:type III-B CRISPR module-associated protein Cmr5 [Verrucomicrobiota bacterium]